MFNNHQQPYYGYNQYNYSNIIRVTSLDEAIMRTTQRGSEMVYFHQDRDAFYIVKMDMNDRKTWQEFPYTVPNRDDFTPASKADISAMLGRIEALENMFKTEEMKNAEST